MTAASRAKGVVSPTPASHGPASTPAGFDAYLQECRDLVVDEIRRMLPQGRRQRPNLYQLMLDYPLREAKGLRPTLAIAACRALGGQVRRILPTAAVLELYHNAFLIHDDVEDESLMRRGRPTLHIEHGIPVAINVGDAMLCLSLEPLLDNMRVVGLGPALRILDAIAEMTRETVAGQATGFEWMRAGTWELTDADYVGMVVQKTGWYSFMTPLRAAAIVCNLDDQRTAALVEFARVLSIAFQIQDDVLNLRGEVQDYGKEIGGDLWEGKRTLMLLHMLRNASAGERREALRILALRRPDAALAGEPPRKRGAIRAGDGANASELLAELLRAGEVSALGRARLERAGFLGRQGALPPRRQKTDDDVRTLMTLMRKHGSIDYATKAAASWAGRAERLFAAIAGWMPASPHRDILRSFVDYVHARAR